MQSVMVFVKRSGVLIACRAFPSPDGATWQCGVCGTHPLLRASFGVMSGFWRCECGAEVELMVDGKPVAIEEVAQVMPARHAPRDEDVMFPQQNAPAKPKRKRRRKLTDKDFLRECGIATTEEPTC